MIEVKEVRKGFAVYFPFALKDSFKATFKTAKWDAENKHWCLSRRSKEKLEQWIVLATPAAEDIAAADEAEMNEAEMKRVESELAEVRIAINQKQIDREKLCTTEMLKAVKEKLKQAKEELEKEKQKAEDQYIKARDIMSNVCDISAINAAHREMNAAYGKNAVSGAGRYRDQFNDACKALLAQQKKLKKMGYYSLGINELYYMNFNRPDRDNPGRVTERDLLEIKEWMEDEED